MDISPHDSSGATAVNKSTIKISSKKSENELHEKTDVDMNVSHLNSEKKEINMERRAQLRRLALESIDLSRDPYGLIITEEGKKLEMEKLLDSWRMRKMEKAEDAVCTAIQKGFDDEFHDKREFIK